MDDSSCQPPCLAQGTNTHRYGRSLLAIGLLHCSSVFVQDSKDLGIQLAGNPPIQVIQREAPPLPEVDGDFEVREGFVLIDSLDAFRQVIKKDNQKIRMQPGIYRASRVDPPVTFRALRASEGEPATTQEQIFAVTGSNNHFDLRGAIFETPVSVQDTLTRKTHMADSWRIAGSDNVFEGGYFRNVVDMEYLSYHNASNEFEVVNDNNTFLDCNFVIKGSKPYGYSDFYGKGRESYTKLGKHSFMSIEDANGTEVIGCQIYNQSFGHAIHMHKVDGVLIQGCLITGALRPTNDIFKEKVGLARENDFSILYRGKRPIPRDEMIPLTEDAVRSYNDVRNVVVLDTVVERQRGCFQLLCTGDIRLENVTVRECGDFCFDLSSGKLGKVVMKNCFADLAYNPVFNLSRGELPTEALYEVTILSPMEGVTPTRRSSLGVICGDRSTFILRDGTTRPLPKEANRLICGGKQPLVDCVVTNYTKATLILEKNVENCVIQSVGPVIGQGKNNKVTKIEAE